MKRADSPLRDQVAEDPVADPLSLSLQVSPIRAQRMKRHVIAISTLFLLTSCHLGYGPLQDRSKFVSARLADDQRTVLFSFHRFAYRAATGWRAFPDGGIPDYATDISVLGTYDLQTRKLNVATT